MTMTMEELLASQQTKPLILTRGQSISGEVVSVNDQEVTLDLGMKSEGVISVRDFPAGKVPSVGDKVDAFVVEPENEASQVVLTVGSLQKLTAKPTRFQNKTSEQDFTKIAEKYLIDEVYSGTVTKISQFGIFVALEEGIEGLIHSSKVTDATLKEGDKIQVSIDSIEADRKRIALSPVITSTKDLIYR